MYVCKEDGLEYSWGEFKLDLFDLLLDFKINQVISC